MSTLVKRLLHPTSKPIVDDFKLFNKVFTVPKPVDPKRIGKIPVGEE